jgi:hypothetical protein
MIADKAESKMGTFSKDWGGFADVVAAVPGGPVHFIQCTSKSNMSSRRRKIMASVDAKRVVRECGCVVELWGWAGDVLARERITEFDGD